MSAVDTANSVAIFMRYTKQLASVRNRPIVDERADSWQQLDAAKEIYGRAEKESDLDKDHLAAIKRVYDATVQPRLFLALPYEAQNNVIFQVAISTACELGSEAFMSLRRINKQWRDRVTAIFTDGPASQDRKGAVTYLLLTHRNTSTFSMPLTIDIPQGYLPREKEYARYTIHSGHKKSIEQTALKTAIKRVEKGKVCKLFYDFKSEHEKLRVEKHHFCAVPKDQTYLRNLQVQNNLMTFTLWNELFSDEQLSKVRSCPLYYKARQELVNYLTLPPKEVGLLT